MYSEQETMQTVILNILLNHERVTNEDCKNALLHANLIKPTTNDMNNTIRALFISLKRFFKEYDISLYGGFLDVKDNVKYYKATEEAVEFCSKMLLQEMYDEDGQLIRYFFQHPIALKKERMELI